MEDAELIGIFIRGYDFWKPKKFLYCPIITVYLIDKENGDCTSKVSCTGVKDLKLSLHTWRHQHFRRSPSPTENGSLYLEEKLLALNSNQKIFLFEISRVLKDKESEKKRIAWAFLIPVASDGTKNINKYLKLQLYKVQKSCKISHETCNIYHLYKDHKLKKFQGVLEVKIAGVMRQADSKSNILPIDHYREEGKKSALDEIKEIQFCQVLQRSRLPTQSCKIPNQLHMILSFGPRGSSCIRFSNTGHQIAVASAERIFIYDINSWTEQCTLKGHDGFIYDVEWSEDDRYLLSVSNDCTCIVWDLAETSQSYILPHPSYVYCGKWIVSGITLVTGCKDHLLRCWMKTGAAFELSQEIRGHLGFVTSVILQDKCTLVSGDSNGCIIIHKLHQNQWTTAKQLELNETSFGIIDSIYVCNSRNRVIVTSRSKGSFMIDLNADIIAQKYRALGNVVLRSVPCLTPCGSLFFSFCQNGEVGVWHAHTGKHLASYESLFPVRGLSEICGSIHYNPFEHMIAIGALDHDYPVLILKYGEEDDSKNLSLVFSGDEGKFYNSVDRRTQ